MTMTNQEVERDETVSLIGSDKVEGTPVYGADRSKIGRIERVMLEKRGGRVAYAVLSFGGLLGIGEKHVPLPWEKLTYDTELDGYLVAVTDEELKGAPAHEPHDHPWDDPTYGRGVHGYWGVGGPAHAGV